MDAPALLDLGKMILAAAGMGACVWSVQGALSTVLPGGKLGELLCLSLCAGLGVALYFLLVLLLRVDEAKLVVSLIKKK